MKKLSVLLFLMLGNLCSFAQNDVSIDYSLEGLARACAKYQKVSSFHDGLAVVLKNKVMKGLIEGHVDEEGYGRMEDYNKYGVIN